MTADNGRPAYRTIVFRTHTSNFLSYQIRKHRSGDDLGFSVEQGYWVWSCFSRLREEVCNGMIGMRKVDVCSFRESIVYDTFNDIITQHNYVQH